MVVAKSPGRRECGNPEMVVRNPDRLDPVVEALRARVGEDLVGIVLFGSRARGEGGGHSDWDLFLIAKGLPENPFDRQLALRSLLPVESGGVSILAKTREEFEASFPPVYLDLAVDGLVLYDPERYIQRKLREIRGIIERAGLRFQCSACRGEFGKGPVGPGRPPRQVPRFVRHAPGRCRRSRTQGP